MKLNLHLEEAISEDWTNSYVQCYRFSNGAKATLNHRDASIVVGYSTGDIVLFLQIVEDDYRVARILTHDALDICISP